MTDLDALKDRLAEYDDHAPKCPKKVERKTNCAPDAVLSSEPTYHDYDFTTYAPCCRPEGHAGECRNGRLILGWPGFVTMSALVAEVERLQQMQPKRDYYASLGAAQERFAVVAWLRARHADTQEWDGYDNATSRAYDRAADGIEAGEHRREEEK